MKHMSTTLLLVHVLILIVGIAYSDDPSVAWVSRYDGSGNNQDIARSIVVGTDGSVYVTGSSVGGRAYSDYVTIKYDSDGTVIWTACYDGSANCDDSAYAITLDGAGNVYVTGSSDGIAPSNSVNMNIVTIKYNSNGEEEWNSRYNTEMMTAGYYIAVDDTGNVYITGRKYDSGLFEIITIKYNSSGVEQWVATYDGLLDYSEYSCGIVVDGVGNVYVSGFGGSSSGGDYATIKYDNDGVEQWVALYNGSGNSSDAARGLAVDADGKVYVTGYSRNGPTDNADYATIKYYTNGTIEWVATYNGPGNGYDEATSIVLDEEGNVYVTGESYGVSSAEDYATIKYNSAGVEQWVARYNGTSNDYDHATAISYNQILGNTYVTGYSDTGLPDDTDYVTVCYDSNGNEQWSMFYDGPGSKYDLAYDITSDIVGNVYVTGKSAGADGDPDYLTIKYSQPVETESQHYTDIGLLALFPILPNPNNGYFTVSLYTPQTSELTLEIYDIAGRLAQPSMTEVYGEGIHQISMGDLSPGLYVCRLDNNTISISEKFVVVR